MTGTTENYVQRGLIPRMISQLYKEIANKTQMAITVRISYLEIRRYTTTTYSNIGRIGIIGKYKDYLDNFALLIAPGQFEKMKCSSCIFENKMVFTFTTILEEKNIEKTETENLEKDFETEKTSEKSLEKLSQKNE